MTTIDNLFIIILSSFLMGIVQFLNYMRPLQFIAHVSMLNERLRMLDDKILKIKSHPEKHDGKLNFDCFSTSTILFETIEVYRETFGRIWKLHESLSYCFGLSILVITLNALMSAAFSLYFSILSHSNNITIDFIAEPSLHTFHISILFVIMIYTCETSGAIVSSLKVDCFIN